MHTRKGIALVHPRTYGGSGVVWVIIAAVVLGGGYVAYRNYQPRTTNNQLQQTAESFDTRDWKTYRNEKYGFEFKYPPHLVFNGDKNYIGEDGTSSYPPLLFVADFGFPENAAHYRFKLEATKHRNAGTWFDEWREKVEQPFDYEGGGFVKNKVLSALDMVVGGASGKKIWLSGSFPTWNMFFGVVRDSRLYTFGYDGWLRDSE